LREEYNVGRIKDQTAVTIGTLINEGTLEPETAWRIYSEKVLPGKEVKTKTGKVTQVPYSDTESSYIFEAANTLNAAAQDAGQASMDFGAFDAGTHIDLGKKIKDLKGNKQAVAKTTELAVGRPGLQTELAGLQRDVEKQIQDITDQIERMYPGYRPDLLRVIYRPAPAEIAAANAFYEEAYRGIFTSMVQPNPALNQLEYGLTREALNTLPTNAPMPGTKTDFLLNPDRQLVSDFQFGKAVPDLDGMDGIDGLQKRLVDADEELWLLKKLNERDAAWEAGTGPALDDSLIAERKKLKEKWDKHIDVMKADLTNTDILDKAAISKFSEDIWKQMEALNPKLKDTRTKFGRAYDLALQMWRELKLIGPTGFIRYTLANSLGDSSQMVISGDQDAVWRWVADSPKFLQDLVGSQPGAYLKTRMGQTLRELEIGGAHPSLGRGHSFVAFGGAGRPADQTSAWRRFGNKFSATIGGSEHSLGGIGRPFEFGRNVNNALEFARRGSLWDGLIREDLNQQMPEFRKQIDNLLLGKANIHPGLIEGMFIDLTTYPRLKPDQMFAKRRLFGRTDVYKGVERLALEGGMTQPQAVGYAEQAARLWESRVNKADRAARKHVDDVLFSYQYRNADVWLTRIIPFHFWASRAIPFYLEAALRHPGAAVGFFRGIEAMEKWNTANGAPEDLNKMLKILGSVGGYQLWMNPLTAIVPTFILDTQMGFDEEGKSRLEKWMDRGAQAGIGLYPWWKALMSHAGWIDAQFNSDPTGTFVERQLIYSFMGQVAKAFGGRSDWFISDPVADMFGWAAKKSPIDRMVPFGSAPEYTGSIQGPQTEINAGISRRVRESMGITTLELGALPESTRAAYELEVQRIMQDHSDPIYQAAYDDVLNKNTTLSVMRATVPGAKRMRQNELLDMRAVYEDKNAPGTSFGGIIMPSADPAVVARGGGTQTANAREWMAQYEQITGRPYKEGDLEKIKDYRYLAPQLAASTPEWRAHIYSDFEYKNLGTPEQQKALSKYYDILFATGEPNFDATDAWEIANPENAKLANELRTLQDAYLSTHPTYAAYDDWKSTYRKEYGSPELAAEYRIQTSRGNPNARAFYANELAKVKARLGPHASVAAINREMEQLTWTIDAYGAVYGIKKRPGTPPLGSSDPNNAIFQAPLPGGEGGSGSSNSMADQVQEFTNDVVAYLKEEQAFNQILVQMSGDPQASLQNLPPPVAEAILGKYGTQFPLLVSEDAQDIQNYLRWQSEAMSGGFDASVANYLDLLYSGQIQRNDRSVAMIPGMGNVVFNSGGGYRPSSFSGDFMGGLIPGMGQPPGMNNPYFSMIPGLGGSLRPSA
jgi:hypothetical protein